MPCYHPLPAVRTGRTYGRPVSVGREGQEFYPTVLPTGELAEPFFVPCGKCIGCRLDYAAEWADRCVMEALDYPKDQCWFVTLTYDECPRSPQGYLTLVPKDVQDFMKRLRMHWKRKYSTDGVRFYLAGEYGSRTLRPHYHMLLYGVVFHDIDYYKANFNGDPLYRSQELDDVWSKGFCTLGELNWHTAAYTARYVMKKITGEKAEEVYKPFGIQPEFVRMSRNPGIGRRWMDAHFDEIYAKDHIQLPAGKETMPPKYLDRILQENDPLRYDRIKAHRRDIAIAQRRRVLDAYSGSYSDYLHMQERIKEDKSQALLRYEI